MRGAEEVAKLLRRRVTLPAQVEAEGDWRLEALLLPQVSCAFRGCGWVQELAEACANEIPDVSLEELTLREHQLGTKHKLDIMTAAGVEDDEDLIYDIYREALAVQERKGVPAVSPAVDRRAFDATLAVYKDESIQALICCCCAWICVQTACSSSIERKKVTCFLTLPPRPLDPQPETEEVRESSSSKQRIKEGESRAGATVETKVGVL